MDYEIKSEWNPADNLKCEFCGAVKHTTLEMIGPMTKRSCLDCQKIPPAYRNN